MDNNLTREQQFQSIFEDILKTRIYTSSNQKTNILPYSIRFEDINSIINDVPIDMNKKYVVFFNFEFVLMLISKKIPAQNITYIANHLDSFNYVKNTGFCDRGVKRILFDLGIYIKNKENCIEYFMKKLGKKDDFIVVGNIPFTINDATEYKKRGRSKNIGDDFISLISKLSKNGKFVYIMRSNFESISFKKNVIMNKNFIKLVYHDKSIFDINPNIKTVHVIGDSDAQSNTFEYCSNASTDKIILHKNENVVLSKNITKSFIPNTKITTLSDLWINGFRLMGDLINEGKYKTITSPGSYKTDDFNWQYDPEENTGIGVWKVIFPYKGGGRAVKIAGPEYSITHSIVALKVESEESAMKLKEWILSNDILIHMNELRLSSTNSKTLFSKIPLPDGII